MSLALAGYATVSAVNRRFMAFSGPDPVQIRLREDTSYCLGIQDWQVADKRSEVILVRCSSNGGYFKRRLDRRVEVSAT